jgi:hypothetical protein
MKYITLVSAFFMLAFSTKAQDSKNLDSKWQIRADYYKPKGIATFSNVTVNGFHFPSNWGVSVGAERDFKRGERKRLYQSFTAGFYNDVYFERVATFETGLGYNYRLFQGFFLGAELNLGYNRAVSSNVVSVYEGDKWVSKVDKSVVTNRFSTTIGLQAGYDLGKHFDGKLPLTLTGGIMVQGVAPFLKGTFPYYAETRPYVGMKWRF